MTGSTTHIDHPHSITVRLAPAQYKQVYQLALNGRRSLASQVLMLIEQALEPPQKSDGPGSRPG